MNEEILSQLKQNNIKAQYELYKKYSVMMFNIAYRYVNNEQDVGSIVNIAFYKIFKTIGSFIYYNEAGFIAWIKKIIINEALCFIRQRINYVDLDEKSSQDAFETIQPDATLNYNDYLKILLKLPDDLRAVFNMYAIDGYSHKEIAEKLNISESGSRVYLTRARKLLRDHIIKS